MDKQRIDGIIDSKQDLFTKISDTIWEYAETRFEEFKSAKLLASVLEAEGFSVDRGTAGIPTAFTANFGQGAPVVALLGEYDALSRLSQKAGIARKEPLPGNQNGHGCGHNLLGAGALAAAVAVKQYMEENKIQGTVRYYGCPGEEGGSGKTFMAREGIFDDVDIAITWHPLNYNVIFSIQTLANYQVYYKFHGRSAHAAAVPHLGRSALDAVELMNVGVNYLREHIIQEARVHYAVTNTGGTSPNVVQPEAEVLYLIRAPKLDQVQEIYERVCEIAKGAALMTGTEVEVVIDKACSNYIPNHTLNEFMQANFNDVGAPQFTEEEKQFARQIRNTLHEADISNDLHMVRQFLGGKDQKILEALKQTEVSDVILPYTQASVRLPGSTDVGDVSWLAPTVQLGVACNAFGTPGHSWQAVAQGATSLAHKGMIVAGKVMARTAVDALVRPEIVKQAKADLQKMLAGKTYICPIPKDVRPSFSK
jgi:aminobenzoyl-glutamate utilization protein B